MGQMGEEQMGGVIVCDKVCVGVVSSSSLLSCEKSPSFLIDEYPGEGFMTNVILLQDLTFGR